MPKKQRRKIFIYLFGWILVGIIFNFVVPVISTCKYTDHPVWYSLDYEAPFGPHVPYTLMCKPVYPLIRDERLPFFHYKLIPRFEIFQ